MRAARPGLGEHVACALDEPVTGGCHDEAPPVAQALGGVVDGARDVAREARHGVRGERARTSDATPAAAAAAPSPTDAATTSAASPMSNAREGPPHRRGSGSPGRAEQRGVAQPAHREEVAGREVDRRLGARGRGAPGRAEELAVRLGEAHGAARDALGLRARRPRHPRAGSGVSGTSRSSSAGASDSMPSTGMPSATFSSRPARLGNSCTISRARWRTGGGEQQFATRRERHALDGLGQRPLVGDRERTQLLDLVAEELDAHGVVGRGREHVEDAAAHRELAAAGDHVDARICEVDELHGERGEVVPAAARRRARSARARRGCRRAAAARRAPRRRRRADAARPASPIRACGAGHGGGGRRSRREGLSRSCGSVSQAGNSRTSASSR